MDPFKGHLTSNSLVKHTKLKFIAIIGLRKRLLYVHPSLTCTKPKYISHRWHICMAICISLAVLDRHRQTTVKSWVFSHGCECFRSWDRIVKNLIIFSNSMELACIELICL